MENTANTHPSFSPMWCNTTITQTSISQPMYDGHRFWYWYPGRHYTVWFDSPMSEDSLVNGNVCYRLQGNVYFCPTVPETQLPPEVIPLPTSGHASNIKPMITLTSVRMENHPEHISVMFSQALNNLK